MSRDIKAIVKQLTLEEKAGLCSGRDWWRTKAVERLGVPSVMFSDGPHGLRKQADRGAHETGINESIKAVCFPTACASTASFDEQLLTQLGETLGDECIAENISVILGPAANIKRSPLCGRNFEYISEDPFLAGRAAAAVIKGVQSKGAGTSLKHFAANNQEYFRLVADSVIDEQTLREIYLAGFEYAVKEAKPWTIMCSYNRLNGTHASEHKWLLTDLLRDEWGFEGMVMSDWGAVSDRPKGVEAGLDLEMPNSGEYNDAEIVRAVREGELLEKYVDIAAERVLTLVYKYIDGVLPASAYDKDAHHAIAAEIESESAVLLKNDGVLPIKKGTPVAYHGEFFEKPRFQGGGSSHINSYKVTAAADLVKSDPNAEIAVVFAGLPDSYESEGYDRDHMKMPEEHNKLITDLARAGKKVVVVLHNGSPVEMPWIGEVSAVLEMYLGGQAVGQSAIDLIFGDKNPSGKLPETFPLRLEHNPSYLNFPGDGKTVEYREGIFVGYRYYDKKQMDVLFPFGHGLSYTAFEYNNLKINGDTVTAEITNAGSRYGKEAVQLYVGDRATVNRPLRELKGFCKVALQLGETKTVTFALDRRSFAHWSTQIHDWYVTPGEYEISIGSSSRDLRLTETVRREGDKPLPLKIDLNTAIAEVLAHPKTAKIISAFVSPEMDKQVGESEQAQEAMNAEMRKRGIYESPLRSMYLMSGVPQEKVAALIDELNRAL